MTLSDGFNSVWLAFQQQLRGRSKECLQSLDCSAALFIGDVMQRVRDALATDSKVNISDSSLNDQWPEELPWKVLLREGWGPTFLGTLLFLARVLRDAPLSRWGSGISKGGDE